LEARRLRAHARDAVLIVGAGLAGLSAAYHLRDRPYLLVEQQSEVGGLCRSIREGGFTFDYTGHLLHMRRPEIRALVFDLLRESEFVKIHRRSGIYSHGTYTDYPFQVNTHGLPKWVIRDCVMGFAETLQHPLRVEDDVSFHDWALATFGNGICRHFMFPYNRKLFRTDLDAVTADWVSWSIPKPTWKDVVRGAQGTNQSAFGYNPSFLYPAAAGIDHLPRAFLPHLRSLRLGTAVVAIATGERLATLSSGETVSYSKMISTMPLPKLIGRMTDAEPELEAFGRSARYVSVLNLNLGFDAPSPRAYHWVYFPEDRFPFYRVGIYSNLSAASVPSGTSAFYVEISCLPGDEPDVAALTQESARALVEVGLVPSRARLCWQRAVHIPYGYVVHDRARRDFLAAALGRLEQLGILSVGRYGAWEYSAMEDALWHGRMAAEVVQRGV
jgi:protoporphyrinogen oxidase